MNFCHFPGNLVIIMLKTNGYCNKNWNGFCKIASKRVVWVVQKTAEATGDLIGNKITDKITSAGKSREEDKTKKVQEIYIPPEKGSKLLMTANFFTLYKNGIPKNCKFAW